MPEPVPARRVVAVAAAAAAVLAVLAGALLGPDRLRLGPQTSGDPALAEQVRAVAGHRDGLRALAVAEVTPGSVRTAGLGPAGPGGGAPGPGDRFEIGSLTKTFTAALFADALTRGEVTAEDRLDRHLPELAGTPAGGVTLGSLARHRSGLPGLGPTAAGRALAVTLLRGDPYATTTTARLLDDAREVAVDPGQGSVYSNFGVALLGTALVRATGAPDLPALVRDRVTGPLAMTATTFAPTAADVPDQALTGYREDGRPAVRWSGEGYLPAGTSTFSTIGDTARWAQAQLTGAAPGTAALDPAVPDGPDRSIGWIWITDRTTGPDGAVRTHTWHNGGTAGFSSMLAIDRAQQRAVVVLGTTAVGVERVATALLHGTGVPDGGAGVGAWAVLGIAALFSLLALHRAVRSAALLPMADGLLTALFGLVLLWNRGPWASVGGWAWGLAAAPVAAALVVALLRARGLPLRPAGRGPVVAWSGPVVTGALVVAALVAG
ncbi:serine hydrolase domain-containing protein [Pseudonocardia spirodelae]|uniref:Serine hydrolase domain-containing protein n=1 Tax=Pseudonocardia spirodelae TaxID=3133431 RepID=A0ABU8T4Q4_9PSEU